MKNWEKKKPISGYRNNVGDNLKKENEKLIKDNNELEDEIFKLKNEVKKYKGLQKIVDSLRMTKRDIAKHFQTENFQLDYLRPRDFEDDKVIMGNSYFRGKGQPKSYVIKKGGKKEDDRVGDNKTKSERAALAIMRIMRAQEQKRKKDD